MSEQSKQSERGSEQSERSEAEHGRVNNPAIWALQSERVALLNDTVFSILDRSAP